MQGASELARLGTVARVTLDKVTKTFHGPRGEVCLAVRDLSLTIEHRQLLVVLGPSGSGKTTLLRLIAGLEQPDTGIISFNGQPVNHLQPAERDVAMVFQNQALYPHLTVAENLALGLRLRRMPSSLVQQRIQEAAAWLGLTNLLHRRPGELSGGQRQQVALGRALVRRPRVFLLDEPLAHLDPCLRGQMLVELRQLHHRLETTMVMVTHDQSEAMRLGQQVAVLHEGRLLQVASPEALYQHPANLFVARFVGWPPMNLLRGTLQPHNGRLCMVLASESSASTDQAVVLPLPTEAGAALADRCGQVTILGLRPEHIHLGISQRAEPDRAWLSGRVEWLEPMGAETWVHFVAAGHPLVARLAGSQQPPSTGPIGLELDLRRAVYFDPASGQALPSVAC